MAMASTDSNYTACQAFPNNQYQCNTIVAIRITTAGISSASCVFCLFLIWAFRRYEHFAQRLVVWLMVAALLDSIVYTAGDTSTKPTPYCTAQGFLMQYFDWVCLLLVCCIAFNLYCNVILLKTMRQFEIVYLGISWLVPVIFAGIPFSKPDGYAPSGLWCWINPDYFSMRIGLWFGPVWVAATGLVIVYLIIFYKLKKQVDSWEGTYNPDTQRTKELLKEDISGLKFYPLVYIIISIFPTINRFQNAIQKGDAIFGLMVMHVLTSPLQGFLNGIVFVVDQDTRRRLTMHQLWAAVRGRLSGSHAVKPYSTNDGTSTSLTATFADETSPLTQSSMMRSGDGTRQ